MRQVDDVRSSPTLLTISAAVFDGMAVAPSHLGAHGPGELMLSTQPVGRDQFHGERARPFASSSVLAIEIDVPVRTLAV